MSTSRSTSRTPSPALSAPPAYSPPCPTQAAPSPPHKPLPVIVIPETKSLRSVGSISTNSSQGIAPYRGSFIPPPPIPGYHAQPHDGRPRLDMPYQAPPSMEEGLDGYLRPSTAGRRQTMYFDAKKANRQSYMSYDSRMDKREEEKEKKGTWSFAFCWNCCLCCK